MSRAIGGLLASLALAGCVAAPTPGDHYYRLATPPAASPFETPRLSGPLRVERLRATPLTDGGHLLFREQSRPSEVQRLSYHHWSDAPSRLLSDQIVRYLRSARLAPRIIQGELRSPAAYSLRGRLHRLERWVGDGGEKAVLELELVLVRESDHSVVFESTYLEEEPLAGHGPAASVEAMDRALARLLERLVADLDAELPSAATRESAWRG